MQETFFRIITIFKNTVSTGAVLTFIPLVVAIFFLQSRFNTGGLLVKLTLVFAVLIAVYLVFKIILKFIHKEEKEQDYDTTHLFDSTLFAGITNKQILFGLACIVGILLFSLIPSPWNIFLILGAFYVMFTMLIRLA